VGIPLIVAAVWFGNPWLPLLLGPVLAAALWELSRFAHGPESRTIYGLGLVGSLLFLVNAALEGGQEKTLALISGSLVLPLLWSTLRAPFERAVSTWAWAVLGLFYVGWLASHAVLLREQSDGRDWLLFTIATTFGVDTLAYVGGRLLGRRKMVPRISPKKTWEGAASGYLGGLLVGYIMALLFEDSISVGNALAAAAIVGVVAQLGDLAESALKRSAGVKEAGGIIPGHGGVLDRLDSLLLAVPSVYYFVLWQVHP
jgi:phosphatidate cytidylyltransferase